MRESVISQIREMFHELVVNVFRHMVRLNVSVFKQRIVCSLGMDVEQNEWDITDSTRSSLSEEVAVSNEYRIHSELHSEPLHPRQCPQQQHLEEHLLFEHDVHTESTLKLCAYRIQFVRFEGVPCLIRHI